MMFGNNKGGKIMLDEYRTLVVKEVRKTDSAVDITFYDCLTHIIFGRGVLAAQKMEDLDVDDVLQIKGSVGNRDVDLASPNALSDFRRIFVANRP